MQIPIPKREISIIALHCSLSPNGHSVSVAEIDKWHQEPDKAFRRSAWWKKNFNPALKACGYNYIIDVDGSIHTGRHLDEIPAQARGHNTGSVAICVIGENKFTAAQWAALKQLVNDLKTQIKASSHNHNAKIMGHYQWPDSRKTCPNFDVPAWVAGDMAALADHILEAA